ncbi:MAG: hypothetical protein JWQ71_4747 [Pedosphaera sp.]|nr:hypothetical protein [Pedosphaera sp.]
MNVKPVIERELRVQARQSFTYVLRMVGVTTLLFVCFYFAATEGFIPEFGSKLFGYINFTLFCSVWILVPPLAADCISREKREGTLGLLFLTPLKARDIVLAKGLVHGLRAFTLWLAVLPVMTIPFLIGGVTWQEAVTCGLVNFSSICWALAAGVMASATGKVWLRCLLMAYILAAFFFTLFGYINGISIIGTVGNYSPFFRTRSFSTISTEGVISMGLYYATDFGGSWGPLLALIPPKGHSAWLWCQGGVALVSLIALLIVIRIAALRLRQGWQDKPPSKQQVKMEKIFCTPVLWVGFLQRWMRRKLERNPIGWLEQRTWSGRVVTWGWFAMMISLYSAALTEGFHRGIQVLQQFMACLLIAGVTVSAAGSFRRERETGVLELLLVSPITEAQIITGRLRGLWGQFLPAMVMLLAIWMYFGTMINQRVDFESIRLYGLAFLTMPVIGLYFSLRRSNFISSFLFTLLLGLLLPMGIRAVIGFLSNVLFGFGGYGFRYSESDSYLDMILYLFLRLIESTAFISLWQGVVAVMLGRRLYRDLASRNFPFEKALT